MYVVKCVRSRLYAPMYVTKLRQVREGAGLSQAEVGRRCDVSEKTVRRWERLESEPTHANIVSLKRLFGLSSDADLGDPLPSTEPSASGQPDLDALRSKAVAEVFVEHVPSIPKDHFGQLLDLARDLAASDGELGRLKRALSRLYRSWLAEQNAGKTATERVDASQKRAGDALTEEATTSGEKRGLRPLPKKPRETKGETDDDSP